MKPKEREIFYKLLIDLFIESPSKRSQTSKLEKSEGTHEKVSPDARRKRSSKRQTNTT